MAMIPDEEVCENAHPITTAILKGIHASAVYTLCYINYWASLRNFADQNLLH